jgi:hypothetical protein
MNATTTETMYAVIDAETGERIGRCGPELHLSSMEAGDTGVVLARRDGGWWVSVPAEQKSFWRDIRGAEVRRVYCEM